MPSKPTKKDQGALDYLEGLSGGKRRGVNSRRKGVNFENKISKILNAKFHTTDFMRSPGSGAFATTHNLPDYLKIYGDLITPKDFKFVIECKKGYNKVFIGDLFKKSAELWKFWSQAERDSKKSGKLPLIVWQQDNKTILVILDRKNKPKQFELTIDCIQYKNVCIYNFEDLLNSTSSDYWFDEGKVPENLQ